jgi:hypothetical protein
MTVFPQDAELDECFALYATVDLAAWERQVAGPWPTCH